MGETPAPEVIERCRTPRGELQLTRRGEHYEIVAGGTFLMATYNGESEQALARLALARLGGRPGPLRVAIGGLGAGYTLAAALADRRVAEAVVIEVEPRLVAWARTHFRRFNGGALDDARTRVVEADLAAWLQAPYATPAAPAGGPPAAPAGGPPGVAAAGPFDAILLDVDNGPAWTVHPGNAWLYGPAGLAALRERLTPGGVLGVWSAHPSPAFAERMAAAIGPVELHRIPVPRGEADCVYLARWAPRRT